jgi:uncharacterized protein YndB with AHSA1/START domain
VSVTKGSWTIQHDYDHGPDRVFAAWADPALKVRWFDLSDAAAADYASDFRVGGRETFRSAPAASPAFTYDAEYRDIVENERIVSTYEISVDGRRTSVSVVTAEFLSTASGTRLIVTEQGAFLDGLDDPESRRSGGVAQLDALATTLDALP